MNNTPIALSVRAAAALTGYTERALRKHIASGALRASRPGGTGDLRILHEDLLAWLRGERVSEVA
jgi:excisionase family DNA binding protein